MVMSPSAVVELVNDSGYLQDWTDNRAEMSVWDGWYRGKQLIPGLSPQETEEYRQLRRRSPSPWAKQIVDSVAHVLYVEGYRQAGEADDADVWAIWQANGMDSRQHMVHKDALVYGVGFERLARGADGSPLIFVESPRKTVAWYLDPANDRWPVYALRGERLGDNHDHFRFMFYDSEARYVFQSRSGDITFLETQLHDVTFRGEPVCPFVRFVDDLDSDGRAVGEIEPLVSVLGRIDQDTFDRLVVQRFGAWKVRYATGLDKPASAEDAEGLALKLRQDSILISDSPDTRFGTLDATDLSGYISAEEFDIRTAAATSNTPPHYLLGQMANLSADAIAAAEAGHQRRVKRIRHSLGESHEQALELAADMASLEVSADAQVRWEDSESRSLSQTADALGKIAQMLNFPVEVLWEKLPLFTQADIERARSILESNDTFGGLLAQLSGAVEPVPVE
jgi:hypothetical protein